jgi:hypothetical protein
MSSLKTAPFLTYCWVSFEIQDADLAQGCQMVCFQTKNPNLVKFWKVLLRKILVYFMTIWSILRPLEIFYGHLVNYVVIWYIFLRFGILDQEKSGNPDLATCVESVAGRSGIVFVKEKKWRTNWCFFLPRIMEVLRLDGRTPS